MVSGQQKNDDEFIVGFGILDEPSKGCIGIHHPTKQIFDERLTNRMKMLYNIVYQTKNTPAQAEGGNMNE